MKRREELPENLPVNLDGIVRQMGTRDPMSGVTVEVKIDGVRYEAVTNAEGAFEFRGLPNGTAFASADAAGHAATRESFKIKEGKVTTVPLWLRPNVSFDDAMVIEAERPEPDISRRSITVAEIKRSLGMTSTLLGFDVWQQGRTVALDVSAAWLLENVAAGIVLLSFTRGQGFLLGRGNQQLTP